VSTEALTTHREEQLAWRCGEIGRYALDIEFFQPFRDFERVSHERLRENLDRAEGRFDLMEELGAPLMLLRARALRTILR